MNTTNTTSQTQTVTIIVNGREKQVPKNEELTYEKVVNLAYDNNPPSGPGVVITVKYSRAEGNKHGTLVPGGEPVKAKEGMIFDVTATDKS